MNPTTAIKKVSQSYEHSEFDSVVNIHYGRNKEKKMITSINNDHDEDFAHIYGYC